MAEKDEDLSNVPSAVRKQERAAEKLVEQIQAKPEDNPAKEVVVVQKTEAEIAAEAAAAAPTDPPVVAPAAIIDTGDQGSQWEHKYNVLKGKYDKEIGDVRGQMAELQLSFERQTKIIEDLNSKQSAPTSAPNTEAGTGDLDPEDFEGWGKEMKDMVTMVNRLNAVIRDQSEIISGLKTGAPAQAQDGDMSQRVDSIEQEMGKTRADRYTQTLDGTIKGDWRGINKDPKFISWLNVVDPISGVPRMAHLQSAAQELRGDQVSSIFNQYIEVAGITPTAPVSFVDEIPVGGGGGEPRVEGGIVRLTEADISKAQQDHIQGRITEAEYDKIFSDYQKELRRQRKG